jgi:raffinose/stachyose/melibiose transport system substrate-binding protein
MRTKKVLALILAVLMAVSMLAACGKDTPATSPTPAADGTASQSTQSGTTGTEATPDSSLKGELTFVHHRTDRVDTTFVEYIAKFNEKYPNIKIKQEVMTDYEGEIKIRMNTADYGDVLCIPNINSDQLKDFFIPLGTVEELEPKYNFIHTKEHAGTVYGLAMFGNANGIVYNKRIFKEAGITSLPKTPDEFIEALKLIKEKTDAIPYYTNYAAGWTLGGQYEAAKSSFTNDPDYVNVKFPHIEKPWTPGNPDYILSKMLYDICAAGLIEEDPLTTDWENSKGMINRGEIACMLLGSWAIGQMAAADVHSEDIGYMPIPYTCSDGKMYSEAGGDYALGININTKYPEAARAWIDFFINESGYAQYEGAMPTPKDQPFPDSLKGFQDLGVVLYQQNPAPIDEAGLRDNIDTEAEIGLWSETYRKRIVEAAVLGSGETFEEIMDDLNNRWYNARITLGVNP